MVLGKTNYTFVMIKNPKYDPKEPYIYFISDLQDARAIENHYLKRWKIECCFKHLKSNGFNIEDINLKIDDKIELMMGVLAMVYIMAVKEGLLSHKLKPILFKKYKDGKKYLSISIFRMGLAIIQTLFTKRNTLIEYIENQLNDNDKWGFGVQRNLIPTKSVQ
jgi:transposase